MFRTTAALVLLLFASAGARAQLIARAPLRVSRPQGVIQPPALPIGPGSLTPPSPVGGPRMLPRPFLVPNTFDGLLGFAPYWPTWYDVDPVLTTNYIPLPVTTPRPAPISDPLPPAQPADLKARLTLNIPPHAQVWLAGNEMDSAANPVILESPELREGQRYSFNIKVAWKERDKMQERSRTVVVDAGDNKSLTYSASN